MKNTSSCSGKFLMQILMCLVFYLAAHPVLAQISNAVAVVEVQEITVSPPDLTQLSANEKKRFSNAWDACVANLKAEFGTAAHAKVAGKPAQTVIEVRGEKGKVVRLAFSPVPLESPSQASFFSSGDDGKEDESADNDSLVIWVGIRANQFYQYDYTWSVTLSGLHSGDDIELDSDFSKKATGLELQFSKAIQALARRVIDEPIVKRPMFIDDFYLRSIIGIDLPAKYVTDLDRWSATSLAAAKDGSFYIGFASQVLHIDETWGIRGLPAKKLADEGMVNFARQLFVTPAGTLFVMGYDKGFAFSEGYAKPFGSDISGRWYPRCEYLGQR